MPVATSPKEETEGSLAALERETKRIRLLENRKVKPDSREEFVRRNNSKMKIVTRRDVELKSGLSFASLGPWG